ncbi:hypothetical protein AVEN_205683-1 [Araneus ventricosus]|uniref:Uncharacterized protein n=1 Tax=Araneus ventricosus TaxID=182803 RepID=A0A4Y2RHI8_ARAVE|nr:hypothetical protein AVEN_205683-1 [Araneus ventricosus]
MTSLGMAIESIRAVKVVGSSSMKSIPFVSLTLGLLLRESGGKQGEHKARVLKDNTGNEMETDHPSPNVQRIVNFSSGGLSIGLQSFSPL